MSGGSNPLKLPSSAIDGIIVDVLRGLVPVSERTRRSLDLGWRRGFSRHKRRRGKVGVPSQ